MLLSLALAATLAADPAPKPFEFKDGDRVVWLGGTLVEREQRYGHWETALLAAHPDRNITLRNLGWSGDTVHGEARGRFDFANADKCFRQIVDQTLELKPTVIFVSYGTNESFEGKEGLLKFEKGLEKLLDALKPAGARVVLFSPLGFEVRSGSPAMAERNEQLTGYRAVIEKVAKARRLHYAQLGEMVDRLYAAAPKRADRVSLTDNGMHLNDLGYFDTHELFLLSLGIKPVKNSIDRYYPLKPLRTAVVVKNELFFHRWRPQNETYLFGFRKHEQGKNAKEVAEFDPLVAKAEEEIAKLVKGLK